MDPIDYSAIVIKCLNKVAEDLFSTKAEKNMFVADGCKTVEGFLYDICDFTDDKSKFVITDRLNEIGEEYAQKYHIDKSIMGTLCASIVLNLVEIALRKRRLTI